MRSNPNVSWSYAHPAWVAGYLDRDAAIDHAVAIGGYVTQSWCAGLMTFNVWRGVPSIHAVSS